MPQTFPIGEELLEIQCSDFAAKEKSSTYQTSDGHAVCMVQPSQHRRYCLYTIADFKEIAEFLCSHKPLLSCPFMRFYRYRHRTDTLMDLGFTAVFVRTPHTLLPCKRNMELLGFISCISTGFWLIFCRTPEHPCPRKHLLQIISPKIVPMLFIL